MSIHYSSISVSVCDVCVFFSGLENKRKKEEGRESTPLRRRFRILHLGTRHVFSYWVELFTDIHYFRKLDHNSPSQEEVTCGALFSITPSK